MKKFLLSLFLVFFLTIVMFWGVQPVSAEQSSPSGTSVKNLKEKIENRIENIKQKEDRLKEERKGKVRQAAQIRWQVFNRVIQKSENLLDKLQIRIDRAKAAGKDVTAANTAMTDARAKLADAKTILEGIKDMTEKPVDKTAFTTIRSKFKAILEDLHVVRKDAAKIINSLKSFNSATSSAVNKTATTSAQ